VINSLAGGRSPDAEDAELGGAGRPLNAGARLDDHRDGVVAVKLGGHG